MQQDVATRKWFNCVRGGMLLTPLQEAARYGHKEVVKLLLDRGAECNKASKKYGLTPLYMAVQGDHFNYGWTPVHWAARKGHKDVVQLLLTKGADWNIMTVDGHTPLTLALQNGHTELVDILQGGDA